MCQYFRYNKFFFGYPEYFFWDIWEKRIKVNSACHTFVLSRLDYCNIVLAGLPASTLAPLQHVLRVAARVVLDLKPRDHVISALRELHWLPIGERVFIVFSSTSRHLDSRQTTSQTYISQSLPLHPGPRCGTPVAETMSCHGRTGK